MAAKKKKNIIEFIYADITPFVFVDWYLFDESWEFGGQIYEFAIRYNSNNKIMAGYFLIENNVHRQRPVLVTTPECDTLEELMDCMGNLPATLSDVLYQINNK